MSDRPSDQSGRDDNPQGETAVWNPGQVNPQDPTMMAPLAPSRPPAQPVPPPVAPAPPQSPTAPPQSPTAPPQSPPPSWSPAQPTPPAQPARSWPPAQPVPPGPVPPQSWPSGPSSAPPSAWSSAPPGWPPAGAAPGWDANPAPKSSGLLIGGIIGALLLTIALVVGVVLALGKSDKTHSDTAGPTSSDAGEQTSPADPDLKITVAGLEDLLPTPATVSSALGISGMEAKETRTAAYGFNDDTASDMACVGVPYVAQDKMYQGSGYSALRGRRLEKSDIIIDTAAVNYPSSDDAAALFKSIRDKWQGCANKPLTRFFSTSNDTEFWKIGTAEATDNTVKIVAYDEGGEGWTCSHALGVKGNATAEALVCGDGMTDQGATLLDAMLASATG